MSAKGRKELTEILRMVDSYCKNNLNDGTGQKILLHFDVLVDFARFLKGYKSQ